MSEILDLTNAEVLFGLNMRATYDYLLMLSSEVQHVWHANWGLGKVLYLLSRYPILVISPTRIYMVTNNITPGTECRVLSSLNGCASVFATCIAEVILMVRVWNLRFRNIWVGVVLACLAIGGGIPPLVALIKTLVAHDMHLVSDHRIPLLSYSVCFLAADDRATSAASCIMLLVTGTTVFLLMFITWIGSYSRGIPFSSMTYTFYKDGLLYFAALLAISIVSVIVNLTQPPEYVNLLLSTQASLLSSLSTRMLLNIRQSVHRELQGVNSVLDPNARYRANSITALRFAATSADEVDSTGPV
ncbi:hypothetical protein AB1N83_003633 [Pleurotus pulmonarius]